MNMAAGGSSRTSVVLDRELRSKLFTLSQALGTDMGDVIRRAIKVFYEYTRMYAEQHDIRSLKKWLEIAEDEELQRIEAKIEDIEKFALEKIAEGEAPESAKAEVRKSKKSKK